MKKQLAFLLCTCLLVSGCATKPTTPDEIKAYEEANDPLEPFNRAMFATNMLLDTAILNPLAHGYRYVTPKFLRQGVSNFYNNLKQPIYLANAAMQGEGESSLDVSKRFMANTFLGLGGLFDVASDMKIPVRENDFGQTLAVWGWKESNPYIVWPLLGPSNPRDTFGIAFNLAAAGAELSVIHEPAVRYSLAGFDSVQTREANIEFMENLQKSSTDFYATIRSMYRQNRQKKIDAALEDSGNQSTTAPKYDFDFNTVDE